MYRISKSCVQLHSAKARSAEKQDPKNVAKFESYYAKNFDVKTIKPHQVKLGIRYV